MSEQDNNKKQSQGVSEFEESMDQPTRQTPEGDAYLFFENDHAKSNINKAVRPTGPKPDSLLRKSLPIISTLLVGVIMGIWVSIFMLPSTQFFKSSSLGRYIADTANNAAFDASSSVFNNLSKELSAVEQQRQIIKEASDKVDMTVSEIVTQYTSSVVTVIAKLGDVDEWGDQRNFIGSGFIINGEGMIATNHHVIANAAEISVILASGEEIPVREINSDPDSDLTILKLSRKIPLPGIVTVGNSDDITVGEQVVAIGSPVSRDFAGTVTSGIISGKDREVFIDGTSIKYLQTDAAINEGNSGGPLFNSRGEVIGINTAKMSEDVQGIGFAIPINRLKEKLDYLSTVPLYTGFTVKDLNPEAYEALNINGGLVVLEVADKSPAQEAGIEPNDIILKFDGTEVSSVSQVNKIREQHKPGDKITLTIMRGSFTFDLTLTLANRP